MRLFGLIGYPLGHSFSRGFFTEKFAKEGIDAEYVNFQIPNAEELIEIVKSHPTLRGLNVTLPHKQNVIPLLDELSDEARAIGAVNVIRITRDADGTPHLKGYNSDVIGFRESIRPLLQPHHQKALVLGTGGASKAIVYGLRQLGIEPTYVSRKASESSENSENSEFSETLIPRLTYADLTPEVMAAHTVIVNCTPLGMFPHIDAAPDIPYRLLTPRHLLYDVVYNPEVTRFMQLGRQRGATVKSGLEMLHLQALASWQFWNEGA